MFESSDNLKGSKTNILKVSPMIKFESSDNLKDYKIWNKNFERIYI